MKESQIERNLVDRIKTRGGLCYKFVSPANPGVPDRVIIVPDGRTVFVELKTESGSLSKIQERQISEMRKRGADVRVCKGLESVKDLVEDLFPGTGKQVKPK